MFIGYKFLFVVYLIAFFVIFINRYESELLHWVSLHPFDILDDIVWFFTVTRDWIKSTSISVSQFIKDKFKNYVVRPVKAVIKIVYQVIKWIFNIFKHYIGLLVKILKYYIGLIIKILKKCIIFIVNRLKYYSELFIEKVAKPLYISISHKIIALWTLLKNLFYAFISTIKIIFRYMKKMAQNIYRVLFQLVKSFSKFYSNSLQYTLRFALKFGSIGELIFTVIGIFIMVSPSIYCYYYYTERWFIIFSTLMTMVLIVTGYKHLSRMKIRVLSEIKGKRN